MVLFDPCAWQREAHALYRARVPLVPALITRAIRFVFGAALPHPAAIGRGTKFAYGALGVVIHKEAVIGERVEIMQNVTIGGNARTDGAPVIGDDAYIGAGAMVLGPLSIGRGGGVAAGAVVLQDVPPHSVVAGVPGRVVREGIDAKEFLFHRRNDSRYTARRP